MPLGNQTYGVGAAAKAYFNTTADKLTVPQAALLAAIANRPSSLNPGANPEKALERRNLVIDKMRDNGAFGTDQTEAQKKAEEYKAAPLGVVEDLQILPKGCVGAGDGPIYGFFCSYLIDYLREPGLTDEQLQRGGLTIKTTMDPKATRAAKDVGREAGAEDHERRRERHVRRPARQRQAPRPRAGRVPRLRQQRRARPGRPSRARRGPAVRPRLGEQGLHRRRGLERTSPASTGDRRSRRSYDSKVYPNGGSPWKVENSGTYNEKMTLTQALAQSPNTGFVILQEKAGLERVVDMAYRLGMRETLQAVQPRGRAAEGGQSNGPSQGDWTKQNNAGSYTLGPGATSVLELANVAATIVSSGTWCPPTPVEKVIDRHGKEIPLKETSLRAGGRARPGELAGPGHVARHHGSGTAARAAQCAGWNRPAIGKTGTTEEQQVGRLPRRHPAVRGCCHDVRRRQPPAGDLREPDPAVPR